MSKQSDERRLRFVLKPTGNDGYVPLPGNNGHRTNMVDLSSGDYSIPLLAQDEMRRYLGNIERGEELGFDAIAVMEQRVPAIYPSSTVAAAWLAARTSRISVGAVGPVSSMYLNPLKIAEEIAM
ncbi:MAG TPA: LLM class flavin-dependent oxidoreductase, partial [Baekduia sp.]|nr:LLM class flavin-dependent oxidoreductase [Baekduia sp.]